MEVMDFNEERHKEMNTDGQEMHKNNDKKPQKNSPLRELFSWIFTFAVAFAAALLIKNYVIINANIPSGSMENTIMPGDRIMALRLTYYFSHPERGDIAVFKYPDDEKQLFIKRLIGLPGEKVQITDGKVYINDSEVPLDDSFVAETPLGDFGPYEVPENCYFMLGDNRNHSKDSRYWKNSFVTFDEIVGKAVIRYYPSVKLLG